MKHFPCKQFSAQGLEPYLYYSVPNDKETTTNFIKMKTTATGICFYNVINTDITISPCE
jgi:hypothetical protein